jgi:tetratricopeptide (TPR) repeat protein
LQERRGRAHAELGQWDQAAADYASAAALRPEDTWLEHSQGLPLLAQGAFQGYRQVCARLMQRFANTDKASTAEAVVSLGVLLPEALKDPLPLVKLAERAVAKEPKRAASLETLGAALYRAGRFDAAVAKLEQAVKLHGQEGSVGTLLFLAMAHHRLNQADQAQHYLDKALAQIERASQGESAERKIEPPSWQTRLRWQLLRRETESLIKPRIRQ